MEPIALPEGARVEVIVTPKESVPNQKTVADILGAIAALYEPSEKDESASRDHDLTLYGERVQQ